MIRILKKYDNNWHIIEKNNNDRQAGLVLKPKSITSYNKLNLDNDVNSEIMLLNKPNYMYYKNFNTSLDSKHYYLGKNVSWEPKPESKLFLNAAPPIINKDNNLVENLNYFKYYI